jgi:hypothetical protein
MKLRYGRIWADVVRHEKLNTEVVPRLIHNDIRKIDWSWVLYSDFILARC